MCVQKNAMTFIHVTLKLAFILFFDFTLYCESSSMLVEYINIIHLTIPFTGHLRCYCYILVIIFLAF